VTLLQVADGAYPHPPYDFLPPDVRVWAGYAGGHTAHAWTAADVAGVREAGLAWWAIWTAVQGRAITRADAQADAHAMIAALHVLAYPGSDPVFYDVEYSTWVANPAQTEDAATFWCAILAESGWGHAYWYGPKHSTATWRADWTGTAPEVLPPGVVGVQYDHALHNDFYDISVFDPALLGDPVSASASDIADAIWGKPTSPVEQGGLSIPAGTRLADLDRHVTDVSGKLDRQSAQLDEIIRLLTPPPPAPPTP
jgi:hypothetical protein